LLRHAYILHDSVRFGNVGALLARHMIFDFSPPYSRLISARHTRSAQMALISLLEALAETVEKAVTDLVKV